MRARVRLFRSRYRAVNLLACTLLALGLLSLPTPAAGIQPTNTSTATPSRASDLAHALSESADGGVFRRLPGLVYHPDGDAIVIENGTRWDNRPLYAHERLTILLSGEQPGVSGAMGRLYVVFARGGKRIALHEFDQRIARYRAGHMEWELRHSEFPDLVGHLTITTLADAQGCAARLVVEGARPGDLAGWVLVPPDTDKGSTHQVTIGPDDFILDRVPATPFVQVRGRFSSPVSSWETAGWRQHQVAAPFRPLGHKSITDASVVAWIPVEPSVGLYAAFVCDDNDPPRYSSLVRRTKPLDPGVLDNPVRAFHSGLERVRGYGSQVIAETPDPYFDAAVRTSVAAAVGLYTDPTFVHGGSHWRGQMPGWRTMGAAYNYGFHEQVKRSLAFWGSLQVKEPRGKPHGVYSENGAQQAGDSRFFGAGFIDYKQPPHYEFQTLMFDEAVRAWRATADPELESLLLPMLELHLTRGLECFDPDGDGLYESYNNTWPNDSVWFSGGGTVEQSGYMYYARRAAADMRRRRGDHAQAAAHDAAAEHIQAAIDRTLWLPRRGHYASYIEQGGHLRVHTDPWIYSQHVPIESGLSSPQQAWQAMHYTEWAMERFHFPFGGEMRQTSNWVPGQWSIRETYPGDNFGMALGYALAGLPDDAWSLFRGTFLHSMYGDETPMRGYGNEAGNYGRPNIISPGGLSHPNCGIDFNDITSMFGRAVVEGIFGYRPDYPNAVVRVQPALPSSWDHAALRTPDFALAFRRTGSIDRYTVHLQRPAALLLRLPVLAREVKAVRVNGLASAFELEPWPGFALLSVTAPSGTDADVSIEIADRVPPLEPIAIARTAGSAVDLTAADAIRRVIDPQQTLHDPQVSGRRLGGRADTTPGHRLLFLELEGSVPRLQAVKLTITDAAGEATRRAQSPREAPADATWTPVDLSPVLNGDIRTIYKQHYGTPRPNTVSMRIAFDGWGAWTFKHWRIPAPEPQLDHLEGLTGADGLLHTPQRAVFTLPALEQNIAFTSLWDNWPDAVTVPVGLAGESVWMLVCGSTNPMQLQIANAVLRFRYADGIEESLDLVPPLNFWSLARFGRVDYDYARDGFVLPKEPPPQVQLGSDCRAIVVSWKLRPGVKLASVTLEALSPEVVIGLMGVSIMNPLP
jgi:hypothetical protein